MGEAKRRRQAIERGEPDRRRKARARGERARMKFQAPPIVLEAWVMGSTSRIANGTSRVELEFMTPTGTTIKLGQTLSAPIVEWARVAGKRWRNIYRITIEPAGKRLKKGKKE